MLQNAHDADKAHYAKHEHEVLVVQAKEAWKKKQEGAKCSGNALCYNVRKYYNKVELSSLENTSTQRRQVTLYPPVTTESY